jgi:hypothetical protein
MDYTGRCLAVRNAARGTDAEVRVFNVPGGFLRPEKNRKIVTKGRLCGSMAKCNR